MPSHFSLRLSKTPKKKNLLSSNFSFTSWNWKSLNPKTVSVMIAVRIFKRHIVDSLMENLNQHWQNGGTKPHQNLILGCSILELVPLPLLFREDPLPCLLWWPSLWRLLDLRLFWLRTLSFDALLFRSSSLSSSRPSLLVRCGRRFWLRCSIISSLLLSKSANFRPNLVAVAKNMDLLDSLFSFTHEFTDTLLLKLAFISVGGCSKSFLLSFLDRLRFPPLPKMLPRPDHRDVKDPSSLEYFLPLSSFLLFFEALL